MSSENWFRIVVLDELSNGTHGFLIWPRVKGGGGAAPNYKKENFKSRISLKLFVEQRWKLHHHFFLIFFLIFLDTNKKLKKKKKNFMHSPKKIISVNFFFTKWYKMTPERPKTKRKWTITFFITGECMVCSNGESKWKPVGPTFSNGDP